jgi:hypothetical protein
MVIVNIIVYEYFTIINLLPETSGYTSIEIVFAKWICPTQPAQAGEATNLI